jgi:hypothetical protein
MAGFELSEYIPFPPEDVFDFMTAAEHAGEIRAAIKDVELVEAGSQGRVGRHRILRQQGGQEVPSEVTVLNGQRPYGYTVATEKDELRMVYDYQLEPAGVGTQVALRAAVEAVGWRKVLAWLVANQLRSGDGDLLKALRRAMEKQEKKVG